MRTPICDFVKEYIASESLRLHMPGHKGTPLCNTVNNAEIFDITEIDGADVLYQPQGIILESEKNAATLFATERTLYSAEGSSLAIKAMLYLALMNWRRENPGERPVILAARNVHKTFVSAAALLDFDVEWIYPESNGVLSCEIKTEKLEKILCDIIGEQKRKPFAVYITSPDYLGNVADVATLAAVCKKYEIMFLVDNAHGAYLKFLKPSSHPMDLGADMCCDSAHKTLPVLTGGAYLHISSKSIHKEWLSQNADTAMSLFASTSPSYIILQSLDRANPHIYENYINGSVLTEFVDKVILLKEKLKSLGYELCGNEPLKVTIAPKSYGYLGNELAAILKEKGVVCEFSDPDFTVMMLSPEIGEAGLDKMLGALSIIPKREISVKCFEAAPSIVSAERKLSVREAVFSPSRKVSAEDAVGEIAANVTVGCPPAIPVVICGERIDEKALEIFKYYDIEYCDVII